MVSKVLFSSDKDEYGTPQAFFNKLNGLFDFTLDPCATPENAKCELFYTAENDGLDQSWYDHRVFCNPPYSKIKLWAKRCWESAESGEAELVVLLIPSRTDTGYWHDYVMNAHAHYFVKGRLKFKGGKTSAPFPSVAVLFKRDSRRARPISISIERE